jgi:hypothetical protein
MLTAPIYECGKLFPTGVDFHEQVDIYIGPSRISVDKNLATIIYLLNMADVRTLMSCEDIGDGYARIILSDLNLVAQSKINGMAIRERQMGLFLENECRSLNIHIDPDKIVDFNSARARVLDGYSKNLRENLKLLLDIPVKYLVVFEKLLQLFVPSK